MTSHSRQSPESSLAPVVPIVAPPPGDPGTREAADAAFLLRYLGAVEAPCPACEYNLHALTQPRCPECGQALRLRVGLRYPLMRAWLTLAVVAFASAGIGILLAAAGAPHRGRYYPAYLAVLYFYAATPVSAAVLLFRRRVLRLPQAIQWAMACTLLVASVLALATVLLNL